MCLASTQGKRQASSGPVGMEQSSTCNVLLMPNNDAGGLLRHWHPPAPRFRTQRLLLLLHRARCSRRFPRQVQRRRIGTFLVALYQHPKYHRLLRQQPVHLLAHRLMGRVCFTGTMKATQMLCVNLSSLQLYYRAK